MPTCATLLTPLRLGPVVLPNRVVSTSHQTTLVEDHLPTKEFVAYHAARAQGGAGAIFLEATAVDPTGLLTSHTICGYLPGILASYEAVAAAVRPPGTRLFVQLFHGGREAFGSAPRAPAVAPSAIPSLRYKSEPRALSRREIAAIVGGYARAAALAQRGGLDGVEVSMSHGYLAAQFFGAHTNRRDDEYAGALEARMRFAQEVLEAIRAEVGSTMAVGVRLSANEMAPNTAGREECAEIADRLRRGGLVDFLSMVLGHSASYAGSVHIAPPPPTAEDAIAAELPVVAAGGDVPLIATTRIVDADHAEAIVASGQADAVGMTRALIADPDLVAKLRAGRGNDVIECIGCNQACIGHYHAGAPIGCVVNPRTGREGSLGPPVRIGGRVLVVGGGPAGISAAVEAARAGAAVTLVERASGLGGQFALAGRAPAHAEAWRRYERGARRDLAGAGVAVLLGTEGTVTLADDHELVVLATGAEPYLPPLGRLGGVRVVQAWEAIRTPDVAVGPVLVADWGGEWAGLDAAEVLAGLGLDVALACAGIVPGESLHQYQRNGYLARLDGLEVRVRHHLELAVVDGESVLRHLFSGRLEALGPVATLVLAQGRRPHDPLWAKLEGRPGVVRVGDVLGPRSLEEAVLEGFTAGRRPPEAHGYRASMVTVDVDRAPGMGVR